MSATLFDDPRVSELLGSGLTNAVQSVFASLEVAEDEIRKAREGKTAADPLDRLWTAFELLRPAHPLMSTEFVYRAHCRELLARVEAREDTRPATDAELACHISDMSQVAMLTRPLVNLQTQIFERRFPEQYASLGIDPIVTGYDQREVDEAAHELRRRHRQDWRRPSLPAPAVRP